MERRPGRPVDPHSVEGLNLNTFKAAASIHQHIREPRLGDDGVDHERVSTRSWHVARVVRTIESDRQLKPPEECRCRRLHGAGRAPTPAGLGARENHEANFGRGEFSPLVVVVFFFSSIFRRRVGLPPSLLSERQISSSRNNP